MNTKIIKVKNHGSTDEPYEVMFYEQEDKTYCVQVNDFEPDCWKNKQNALDYFNYFRKNKIIIK